MQIFVTDPCPIKSAIALDDKRLNKMILESAQILSTALRLNGVVHNKQIYRAYSHKSPVCIWAGESLGNMYWLLHHFYALEYHRTKIRGFKSHASFKLFPVIKDLMDRRLGALKNLSPNITPFRNSAKSKIKNLDFTSNPDVYQAYRNYLTRSWNREKKVNWKNWHPPEWYVNPKNKEGLSQHVQHLPSDQSFNPSPSI